MSRVFTIVVILLLMAVVALVPRMGSDNSQEPGPDLGDGFAYREDTLTRFRQMLLDPGWSLSEPPRNPQGMLQAVHDKTGLNFVLIPAGSFLMGSPEVEKAGWQQFEAPAHTVAVLAFLLSATECTQRGWERGGGQNDSFFTGADRPVERVIWADCHDWCARNGLRLPSESEWEYACRAGSTGKFYFGDDKSALSEYAWYSGNSGPDTHSVREKLPNAWGLFDMHGNVREWCEDTWHDDYMGAPADGSAWTTGYPGFRVKRGGDWHLHAETCRSARRSFRSQGYRRNVTGFRPAADLPDE